jgi:L-threonylcarbamoyladenylate synthase
VTEIQKAAELLRAGRLVAFPTETVYGLGANALDEAAVRRIFEAKGRPLTSPLIVHVGSVEMARGLASRWPEEAEKLAGRFWPGPLTLVVPKAEHVPDLVTAGLGSVGLRIPAHPVARALIEAAGVPVAAPSANRFTELSPTTAEHVRAAFEGIAGGPEMVLDGGACEVGIESTVLSLTAPRPRILRPGMVTRAELEKVVGEVEEGGGAESPGQHPRHYSPRTAVYLQEAPGNGRGFRLKLSGMPGDAAGYAQRLYGILHELDRRGYDWISIEMPPDTPEWAGVRDRLKRAAG